MSKSLESALGKAEAYLGKGKIEEAEKIFRSVTTVFPENDRALEGLSKINQGSAAEATPILIPPQEKIHEIIDLYNRGQFEEVLQKAEEMIRHFTSNIMLLNLIAAAHAGLDNLDQAIENFNKVLEVNSHDAVAYYNIGNIYKKKQDHDAEIESYKKALSIQPNHFQSYNNMGNALRVKGELDAAIEQFTQALSIKPDFAEAHYNLGVALQEKDDFNAAIGSYEKACVINPSYIKAYVNMGNALKQKGDLDAAIDRYKRAIKIKPDCAEGHYSIGVVLQEKSELNEAIDSYKRAIKFKPDYAEAHFNLGVIFQGRDDLDVSIENYKAAIEIRPNFGDAYSNIGIALQNKNELDAAVDIYKQALTVNPNHTESFINLEMLYFQLMETYKAHDQLSLIGNDKLNALLFEEPKHHIVQSIYYLLLGQTKASKAHLQGYKKLATSKKTKELTTNDQVFCSAYAKFLEHLIKKIPVYRSQSNRKIYHIGESHCLSYAHHNIMIKEKPFCISPVITFGAKSYHFSQETENTYKAITKRNLDCIPNESYIFISVGEIDCRAFGGLIQASEKSVSQLADIVHQTVRGYVTWFSKANLNKKHKYIFFNIPAPIYQKALSEDLNEKVALVVCLFNEELEEILKTTFFNLIDVYNATKDKSGFSNGLYHCDNAHLDSRILPLVQDEINKCDTF